MNLESSQLISNNLNKDPFSSLPIKFAIKNLFPWAEIHLTISYSNNDLPAHYRSFQMGISVVFVSIMVILRVRFLWGKLFKPDFEVMMQTGFIIIDENRC